MNRQNPNAVSSGHEDRAPSHSEFDMEDLMRANPPDPQSQTPPRQQDGPRSREGAAQANRANAAAAKARLGILMILMDKGAELASALRLGYADPSKAATLGVDAMQYTAIRKSLMQMHRAYTSLGGNQANFAHIIRSGPELARQIIGKPCKLTGSLWQWLGREIVSNELEGVIGFDEGDTSPIEAMKDAYGVVGQMVLEARELAQALTQRPAALSNLDSVAANPSRPEKTVKAKKQGSEKLSESGLSGTEEPKGNFFQRAWKWVRENPLVSVLLALGASALIWRKFRSRKDKLEDAMEPAKPSNA